MARPRRSSRRSQPHTPLDVDRLMSGVARVEVRYGIEWSVQTVTGQRAVKDYTCPGCSGTLVAGVAHVVVWRHDSIMGEASAIAERRHWHLRCWRAV